MLIILKLAIIVENKKVNCSRKTDRDRLFTTKKKRTISHGETNKTNSAFAWRRIALFVARVRPNCNYGNK